MLPSPEYGLLLDAVVPLDHARADCRGWDSRRWGQELRIADWHRLSPVLFCHLAPGHEAPAAVLSALERAYLANAARIMFIRATRQLVVAALLAAEVPAMLLKGAALIETAYSDPAQREMLDLDILVPGDLLRRANEALATLGYRPEAHATTDERASAHAHNSEHHDPPLVGEEHLVAVELHHHIVIAAEGARFDIGGFWERARTASDGGHMLPSPEDVLLHVCLHFTSNRLGGRYVRRQTGGALGQICDVARIVEQEELDWERLVATTREYRLEARVFLGLFAARTLGVTIPSLALEGLRPAGLDDELGRRLVSLRVLRADDHLPVRTLRWMVAPSREVLSNGWNADPTATMSLARAYMRRARAHAPLAGSALRRPWSLVQDRRLDGQIRALEERA
jgi:hypothetical protein